MNNGNNEESSENIQEQITKAQQTRIINEGKGYEPSTKIKRTYLPLRKKERLWGGVQYPGLFDYESANDSGWFWFTVLMEVMSLSTTYFLLAERISGLVLLISALCLFGLDFAFAYFHHRYKSIECLIENQKRLFFPTMRAGVMAGTYANYAAYLEQKLKDNKDCKYLRFIFALLIWLLSLFKGGVFFIAVVSSYWFQLAVSDSKTPYLLVIVIIASYIWIAYNHLNFTGYFLAAYSNKFQKNAESAAFNRSVGGQQIANERQDKEEKIDFKEFIDIILDDKTNPYLISFFNKSRNDIEKDINKGIKEIKVQSHGIYKTDQSNIYTIHRYGLLTDDQLQEMINVQETKIAELAVAIYGHGLQMQSGLFVVN